MFDSIIPSNYTMVRENNENVYLQIPKNATKSHKIFVWQRKRNDIQYFFFFMVNCTKYVCPRFPGIMQYFNWITKFVKQNHTCNFEGPVLVRGCEYSLTLDLLRYWVYIYIYSSSIKLYVKHKSIYLYKLGCYIQFQWNSSRI